MNSLLSRWLPAVTLATWSGVLFYYHFSARMTAMLAPEFRIYAFIAAIVLALMALVFIFTRADAACCSSAECGHGLSRLSIGKWLTFLILIVPLTVAARYTPREGFSQTYIKNQGTVTDSSAMSAAMTKKLDEKFAPAGKVNPLPPDLSLPTTDGQPAAADTKPGTLQQAPTDWLVRTPEGYIVAEVLDLLYAAQDQVLRQDFEGKKVQLIGQFMPDPGSPPTRFKAVRMFMTCCAADARPVATLVETESAAGVPEMTWIKIIGTPTFPVEKGRRVSVLKAEKIEKTEPPPDAMLQ